jgi:hypothetical protein
LKIALSARAAEGKASFLSQKVILFSDQIGMIRSMLISCRGFFVIDIVIVTNILMLITTHINIKRKFSNMLFWFKYNFGPYIGHLFLIWSLCEKKFQFGPYIKNL